MSKLIEDKVKELREIVERELPESVVRFEVVFTGTNTSTHKTHRYIEDLNREGISMRNLKGEFIK